jgi:hypothetical protein
MDRDIYLFQIILHQFWILVFVGGVAFLVVVVVGVVTVVVGVGVVVSAEVVVVAVGAPPKAATSVPIPHEVLAGGLMLPYMSGE